MARQPILFIIRGAPSSGKRTYAKHLIAQHPGAVHLENKDYIGAQAKKDAASEDTDDARLAAVRKMMKSGKDTIVADSFTTREDLLPYLMTLGRVQVVEMETSFASAATCAEPAMKAHQAAFEPHPGALRILQMQEAAPDPSRPPRTPHRR